MPAPRQPLNNPPTSPASSNPPAARTVEVTPRTAASTVIQKRARARTPPARQPGNRSPTAAAAARACTPPARATFTTPRTQAALTVQRQLRGKTKKKKKRDPDAEIAVFLSVMSDEIAHVERETRDRHRVDRRMDHVHLAVLTPEMKSLEAQIDALRVGGVANKAEAAGQKAEDGMQSEVAAAQLAQLAEIRVAQLEQVREQATDWRQRYDASQRELSAAKSQLSERDSQVRTQEATIATLRAELRDTHTALAAEGEGARVLSEQLEAAHATGDSPGLAQELIKASDRADAMLQRAQEQIRTLEANVKGSSTVAQALAIAQQAGSELANKLAGARGELAAHSIGDVSSLRESIRDGQTRAQRLLGAMQKDLTGISPDELRAAVSDVVAEQQQMATVAREAVQQASEALRAQVGTRVTVAGKVVQQAVEAIPIIGVSKSDGEVSMVELHKQLGRAESELLALEHRADLIQVRLEEKEARSHPSDGRQQHELWEQPLEAAFKVGSAVGGAAKKLLTLLDGGEEATHFLRSFTAGRLQVRGEGEEGERHAGKELERTRAAIDAFQPPAARVAPREQA